MNVLDPIHRQVRAFPERDALVFDGQTLSYGQMWHRCGRAAWLLQQEGIARGQCVALGALAAQVRLMLMISLARIGVASVTVMPSLPVAQRDQLFAQCGASAWIVREMPEDPGAAPRRIAPGSLLKPGNGEVAPIEEGLQDAIWRLALSSGTTGSSKCVAWTHGQAATLQRLSLDAYPAAPGERLLIAADITIGLMLGHALQQLAAGGTVILPRAVTNADHAAGLQRDKPTRLLTTPAIATSLLRHLPAAPAGTRHESLLGVMLGGSFVTPKLRAEVEARLCSNVTVIYGSTEIGSTARSDLACRLEQPSAAGRLLPWVEAQVVDDAGALLPAGEVGNLRFRAPAMAAGYVGDAPATAAAFREGWFYPGDRGSIDANRLLTLSGRIDDLMNLNGFKLDPAPVEAALAGHPSVREAAATTFEQHDGHAVLVMLAVPAEPGVALDEQLLVTHLRSAVHGLVVRMRVVAVDALPRTSAGKLARASLPELSAQALKAADEAQSP